MTSFHPIYTWFISSLLSAEPRGLIPHLCQFNLWMCRVRIRQNARTKPQSLKVHSRDIRSSEGGRKAPPHRCDCLSGAVLHHVKQSWWRTARLHFWYFGIASRHYYIVHFSAEILRNPLDDWKMCPLMRILSVVPHGLRGMLNHNSINHFVSYTVLLTWPCWRQLKHSD